MYWHLLLCMQISSRVHQLWLWKLSVRQLIIPTIYLCAIHSLNNTQVVYHLWLVKMVCIYHPMSVWCKVKLLLHKLEIFRLFFRHSVKLLPCHSSVCICFHCVTKIKHCTSHHQSNAFLSVLFHVNLSGQQPKHWLVTYLYANHCRLILLIAMVSDIIHSRYCHIYHCI